MTLYNAIRYSIELEPATSVPAIDPGAQPGLRRANQFMDKKVGWAIGGFHLMHQDMATIEQTIRTLQSLGVKQVVPTHCTGEPARLAFHQTYGEQCINGGAGREILFF